jgi:hypothetical protein
MSEMEISEMEIRIAETFPRAREKSQGRPSDGGRGGGITSRGDVGAERRQTLQTQIVIVIGDEGEGAEVVGDGLTKGRGRVGDGARAAARHARAPGR